MKIIVIDDDPTGSQTVNGCSLLLKWDHETLLGAFNQESNLIFILANTRSLSPLFAEARTREICQCLRSFLCAQKVSVEDILLVSRGDSTLRGHGVLEPEVIASELGPFDATFHVPAFFEGGRTTKDGIHLLNGFPVHKTDFARDKIFGYSSSHLAKWLEEKSKGKINASSVFHLKLKQLDLALASESGFLELVNCLSNLNSNRPVIVDAQFSSHLNIFSKAIKLLIKDKRFLFRSAASLLNSLSGLPSSLNNSLDLLLLRDKYKSLKNKPGLIIIGSHVKLADEQLKFLLQDNSCEGLEIDIKRIYSIFKDLNSSRLLSTYKEHLIVIINRILASDKTLVLYTSRGEVIFESVELRMEFGLRVANFMAGLVRIISSQIGYIISKGGITTQILLEKGLNLKKVNLEGQILPGLSLVSGSQSDDTANFPIVTFPGNLGNKSTLLESWKFMENRLFQ